MKPPVTPIPACDPRAAALEADFAYPDPKIRPIRNNEQYRQ